jgi:hypothetical protein
MKRFMQAGRAGDSAALFIVIEVMIASPSATRGFQRLS